MRRITPIAMAMAFLLTTSPLQAQGIDIGARAGATFATIGGDDVDNASYKTGFSLGAHLALDIGPMFSLRPELNYMSKGSGVDEPDLEGDLTLNLTYLQIPVLAQVRVPNPVGPSFYFFAGPAVDIETGCTAEFEGGGISASVDCDNPDADLLARKNVTWGVVGGGGVGFGLGVGEATLGVRYDYGLTSIDDSAAEADIKNRAFSVMVGYTLGLGM